MGPAQNGRIDCIRLLLESGAEIEAKNNVRDIKITYFSRAAALNMLRFLNRIEFGFCFSFLFTCTVTSL